MGARDGNQRCAITGASGYLGSRLARALAEDGWDVYGLSRRPLAGIALERHLPFSLGESVAAGFFREQKIDVLVHCAYDFSVTKWSDILERNVKGSIELMRAAREGGVRANIFISTISAFRNCRSMYGRAKLLVENEAWKLGAIVIRPGLIYGDQPGSMIGALRRAVSSFPIVPLIGRGGQVQYLTHEDDLASMVIRLCKDGAAETTSPIVAASEDGRTFRSILEDLSRASGRKVRLVPFPSRLFWLILRAGEAIGMRMPFRSDSIVSLVNQDPAPDFSVARRAGFAFRRFEPSGNGQDESESEPV